MTLPAPGSGHIPDPCATDRVYTDDEGEFMSAVYQWRTRHHYGYPALKDFLRVALSLGYRKTNLRDSSWRPAE